MEIKLSKFYSLVLAIIFLIGIQETIQAQITVFNFTTCPLTVYIGQADNSTAVPCDLCPINPPSAILVAPFGSVPIFGQDVCGEDFLWVAWTNSIIGSFGINPNPGLTAACVPSVLGPACTGGPTNAFWFGGGGSGPVSVAIF